MSKQVQEVEGRYLPMPLPPSRMHIIDEFVELGSHALDKLEIRVEIIDELDEHETVRVRGANGSKVDGVWDANAIDKN